MRSTRTFLPRVQLTTKVDQVYQGMIDRGWRRSGTYCYKPDLRRSCCPQYTIRLDTNAFIPSKRHRKIVNRWNRFVLYGESDTGESVANNGKKSKASKSPAFTLATSIHAAEREHLSGDDTPVHTFEVTLESSTYTDEKFELFEKYQTQVHNDDDNSPGDFARFLVESPLLDERIPYPSTPPSHLPLNYGSYHQMYRLDGKLMAMAVLDILPDCVSSVYFMYDDTWERFSLGKMQLSALREASLAQEMHEAGAPGMNSLYMGYYIYTCQKMRYKGEYSPSYLVDPETYSWFPLQDCTPLLEKNRYACFSNPRHSIVGNIPLGKDKLEKTDTQVSETDLNEIYFIDSIQGGQVTVIPVVLSKHWLNRKIRTDTLSCIHGLGIDLSKSIILNIRSG